MHQLTYTLLTRELNTGDGNLPCSVDDALAGMERNQWKEAIEAELTQLKDMGMWKLEELPPE
jgi:hypothetical protein